MDFGLAKSHITKEGTVVSPRQRADFRGTVSFASLNAHECQELSRRDDLWSWFFVLLDFYNEPLQWRKERDLSMDDVFKLKKQAIEDPDKYLWGDSTADIRHEVREIFDHILELEYAEAPDYDFISEQLLKVLAKAEVNERYLLLIFIF